MTWLIALLLTSSSWALPLHETYIVHNVPDASTISDWSSRPGQRSYLFQLYDPSADQLEPLLALRGADSMQLEVTRFPGEDSAASWKKLATQGVTLVGLDAGLPTDDETERLNRIGFSKYVFVLTYYPGPEEAARLARLKGQVAVSMVVNAYPRFVDKEGLQAIPARIPLLFATDYWPWYTHMDLFNMLEQPIRLRVKDMFPPAEELQYLRNIKRLQDVSVETDGDAPDASAWKNFGEIPVRWTSRDWVPSANGVAAFEKSGPGRKLTVDMDRPMSDEERARLERSTVPVEWIHSVY